MVSLKPFVEALDTAPVSTKYYVCIDQPPLNTLTDAKARQTWSRDRVISFEFMNAFLTWYLKVLNTIYFNIENHTTVDISIDIYLNTIMCLKKDHSWK